MTDYSRAGSPGDRGLLSPAGGLAAPGSPNGRHPGDGPDDVAVGLDPGLDHLDPYPEILGDEPEELGEELDGAVVDEGPADDLERDLVDDLDDDDDEDDDDEDDEDDEEAEAEAGAPASRIVQPRAPVPRRTMLVSVGTAGAGLVALVVAVLFAVSGFGPLDRPLLISPVGLDGGPASTAGAVAAVPPKPGGKVPRVVGMTFARAKAIVEAAGFRVEARYQQGSQPRETVLAQEPAPGTVLGRRGVVILVVSLGIVEGPVTGPLPTSPPLTDAPQVTRLPTPTTRRPTGTTSKPTTTNPPTTPPTEPPTTPPPTEPPPTTAGTP